MVVDLFMIGYMTGPATLAPILIVRPRRPVARGPKVRAATAQAALLGGAEAPQAASPSPSPGPQHPLAATRAAPGRAGRGCGYRRRPRRPLFRRVLSVGVGVTSSMRPILMPERARARSADWAPGPGVFVLFPPVALSFTCRAVTPSSCRIPLRQPPRTSLRRGYRSRAGAGDTPQALQGWGCRGGRGGKGGGGRGGTSEGYGWPRTRRGTGDRGSARLPVEPGVSRPPPPRGQAI